MNVGLDEEKLTYPYLHFDKDMQQQILHFATTINALCRLIYPGLCIPANVVFCVFLPIITG